MAIPGGFGSTLIGGLISAMGVLIAVFSQVLYLLVMQTYVYYMHYSDDASAIRFLVTSIWILDTLRFSLVCHFLYYYLITNYGIPTSLLNMIWFIHISTSKLLLADKILQVIAGINSGACNCGYCSSMLLRAPNILPLSPSGEVVGDYPHCEHISLSWQSPCAMTRSWKMLSLLAGTGFSIGLFFSSIMTNLYSDQEAEGVILVFIDNETSLSPQISFYVGTPALVIVIIAEILITVSLCTLFCDNSSRSTFPRTKRLLNTLIIYAVNRCLLTLLFAIAELAANVNHQNAWTIAFDFVGQGLYPNSLLASLNARQYLRAQASSTITDLRISVVDLGRLSKLKGNVESSEDGTGPFREAFIDITADPSLTFILLATMLSGVLLVQIVACMPDNLASSDMSHRNKRLSDSQAEQFLCTWYRSTLPEVLGTTNRKDLLASFPGLCDAMIVSDGKENFLKV
ncbi:hypothetical protein F5141DRAFT_1201461 [Pisolithus sp. B1]|nr:hypothetical protein F5141DRAFT_1201461 [Pisolithus sp. B1]